MTAASCDENLAASSLTRSYNCLPPSLPHRWLPPTMVTAAVATEEGGRTTAPAMVSVAAMQLTLNPFYLYLKVLFIYAQVVFVLGR